MTFGPIRWVVRQLASAGAAAADPTKAQMLTLVSDNGHTYRVVVNSSGALSPAHDVNSTSTLTPLSFGETTGTVTDANGNVVDRSATRRWPRRRGQLRPGHDDRLHLHQRRHVRVSGSRAAARAR